MADDPLAQFRKTSPSAFSGSKLKEPDEYVAFAGKDKAPYLEIRRAMAPTHSPKYAFLTNVSFDGRFATNCVLQFTIMLVLVRGRNLQEMIFAIQNGMKGFIQEFDPDRWEKPKDEKAAFIESIEVHMLGSNAEAASIATTH